MDAQRTQDSGIVGRVKESATAQLATQKDKATDGLGSVAQAMRQTTQHLRTQQHDTVARYAEQAADQIERFSQRLRDKDVGELLDDAQQLARRQPALFIGGAFAIGLLGARFLKSSSNTRDWRSDTSGFNKPVGFDNPRAFTNPTSFNTPSPTANAYGNTVPSTAANRRESF